MPFRSKVPALDPRRFQSASAFSVLVDVRSGGAKRTHDPSALSAKFCIRTELIGAATDRFVGPERKLGMSA